MDGDVLIVGAGPVGLTLANDLARRGVPFRIVDALTEPNPHAKAHGLQSRTLEALDVIGLGRAMVDNSVRPQPTIMSWERGKPVTEVPAGGPPHQPYPYQLTIWQQTVERVLADALAAAGHSVERGCRLVDFSTHDDGVVVSLERNGAEETLRCGWIVGCDGGRSAVRSILGLQMAGDTEPGQWFIGEFDMDWAMPRDVIFLNRHPKGTAAACFDPLTEKWHAWVTMLDASVPLSLDKLNELWREYTGLDTAITNPSWMHELKVNYGTVDHYVQGRAILAGDAAHVHSSAGGQGLNTGVQDALNLGWKLALTIGGDAAPGLLQTYDEERLAEAHNVLALSKRMHKVMYPANVKERVVAKVLGTAMSRPALAERFLNKRMSMLHIHYKDSSLTGPKSDQGSEQAQAGSFLADAGCRVDGAPTTLYDVLRGPTAELIFCTGDAPASQAAIEALQALERSVAPLGKHVRVHYLVGTNADAHAVGGGDRTVIVDSARQVRRALGLARPEVIFVRPDGYIAYRSTLDRSGIDVSRLRDHLQRIYAATIVAPDGGRR